MKITITRSFSRTKQVAAFEPINAFCSMQMECDEGEYARVSMELSELCIGEVEKTIQVEMEKVEAIKKTNEF